MRFQQATLAALACGAVNAGGAAKPEMRERITGISEIESVWSGHPVGFALLTAPPLQYVAYYDAQRRMTVASRRLDSPDWIVQKLPSTLGWDSHNYVTMAVDKTGNLHVSGNMHCNPLVYFRTRNPGDVTTLERIPHMVRPDIEGRVTYPLFLEGPGEVLLFRYRNGSSGRGDDHYNQYDPDTCAWGALIDTPLLDGQDRMNGYFSAPTRGPDGRFHMAGVWRDTPDAATNHHPSYARSTDLVHWEKADGTPIPVPMTVATIDVVEDLPPHRGLINGNCALGFDAELRPIVSYHRYDEEGNSQIYCARFEETGWHLIQVSRWDGYRWDFGGGGSIPFEVGVGGVAPAEDGTLHLSFRRKGESGSWALDPQTLQIMGAAPPSHIHRASLGPVESDFPGMLVKTVGDMGRGEADNVRYVLRWETLGPNRDRPRPEPHPEPVMLRLYRLETEPLD